MTSLTTLNTVPLLLWFYVQGQRFEAKAEAVIANARHPYHGPAWLLYGLSLGDMS